jgi:cytochrome c peroxidase
MTSRIAARAAALPTVVLLLAYAAGDRAANADQQAPPSQLQRPSRVRTLRLPAVPYRYAQTDLPSHFTKAPAAKFDNTPADNPITDAGATLGRVLFYDTRFSANGTISCGSCHVQKHGFADPRRASRGFHGGLTDRHAMNLVNLRYHPRARFFWDERAGNLESMVLLPVENPLEMGQTLSRLPELLGTDLRYRELFHAAFGDRAITNERVARALAQFLRALVSYRSRYDEGRPAVQATTDDFPNFTAQENRGKALFVRHCAPCHLPDQDAHFIMTEPVNTGLDADTRQPDGGVGDITLNPREVGLFKSPSLRNVEVTGPYMHDGRLPTLDDVLDHYSSGGKNHPNKDIRVQPLNLTATEKTALVAFLKTLTDPHFLRDPRFADPFTND